MTVYTLGYEKRNIEDYIQLLKTANVQILLDIRETAWSYKRDFRKAKLKETLAKNGIHYVHLKHLGNPKNLRKSALDRDIVLEKYRVYLEETESGIFELIGLIDYASTNRINLCLTCYEKDQLQCHRSVIIEHIKSILSINVTHL